MMELDTRPPATHAITRFLFPAPAKRTAGSIIMWWERRRLAYNGLVGAAGLFSIAVGTVISALPPFSSPELIPWQVPVVFGIAANICYTLGPTVEILIEKLWRGQILPTGPALFRMGLTFSVGLALLPTLLLSFLWVVASVLAIF